MTIPTVTIAVTNYQEMRKLTQLFNCCVFFNWFFTLEYEFMKCINSSKSNCFHSLLVSKYALLQKCIHAQGKKKNAHSPRAQGQLNAYLCCIYCRCDYKSMKQRKQKRNTRTYAQCSTKSYFFLICVLRLV